MPRLFKLMLVQCRGYCCILHFIFYELPETQALRLIRRGLGEETALLGFAGSPWTLANFMVEGGSAKEFTRAKVLFYSDRHLFGQLMKKLTKAVQDYLHLQIDAGVDAVQIFDSLGGTLAQNAWEEASGRWINEIIAGLRGRVPVILFARGVHGNWAAQAASGARVIGLDWGVSLAETARLLPPEIALQGNLDPALLQTTPRVVEQEARRILEEMRGRPGHVFNLGHGVSPGARLDCMEALVNTVQQAA